MGAVGVPALWEAGTSGKRAGGERYPLRGAGPATITDPACYLLTTHPQADGAEQGQDSADDSACDGQPRHGKRKSRGCRRAEHAPGRGRAADAAGCASVGTAADASIGTAADTAIGPAPDASVGTAVRTTSSLTTSAPGAAGRVAGAGSGAAGAATSCGARAAGAAGGVAGAGSGAAGAATSCGARAAGAAGGVAGAGSGAAGAATSRGAGAAGAAGGVAGAGSGAAGAATRCGSAV